MLIGAATLSVGLGVLGPARQASPAAAASASTPSGAGSCIGHHPQPAVWYVASCTGHDEPELDPVSSAPGSARNLTWKVVLPSDGSVPVSAVGPTFWFGGAVSDPNPHALFGQAFLEVQFYPDSVVTGCTPTGGFSVTQVANAFSVCTPVWQVGQKSFAETAAFNAMLTDSKTGGALVMHGGDTVTVHFHPGAAGHGWNITITDQSTGHAGTVVLDSKYGPLLPLFSRQRIGNSLGWGLVHDTPNAFVWEIGHTSPYTHPASEYCVPGQTFCDSYDIAHWLGFTPLRIESVTFGGGTTAQTWATVSDLGGAAEVEQDCGSYGGPYCEYPWYALNGGTFTYGGDYPGTTRDFGQASQFATTMKCGGPFGADSTYCAKIILR
ncbi:MAG TPA: hypothetical protein VFI30_02830 [Nocardioidaceae bacterium]|nr:hypothetical protein [Nocardioidaceae bacterium]